jgi:hypothetical protein
MSLDLGFLGGLSSQLGLGAEASAILSSIGGVAGQFIPGGSSNQIAPVGTPLMPTTSLAQGLQQGGGSDDQMASMRADPVLTMLVHGRPMADIRKKAREMKASKQDLLTHLGRITVVDISSQEGAQPQELTVSDKVLLAQAIKRIFPGRRHAGPIPKGVARWVEKSRAAARIFMSAPKLLSIKKRRSG